MDTAAIISLCTAGAGAITALILIIAKWQEVVDKHMTLKERKEQKKQQKLEAEQSKIVAAVQVAIKPAMDDLCTTLTDLSKQLDVVKDNVASLKGEMDKQSVTLMYLVKDNINRAHKRFMLQGYIDRYSLDILEHLFESYKDLGGNSFVSDLMEDIRSLPIQ